MEKVTLGNLIGHESEDLFADFDVTEVQELLSALRDVEAIDLAHAEDLAQKSLRCADVVSEYLGKLTKTVSYLENKTSSMKNKISLEYEAPAGRTTAEMKKWAADVSPEVEAVQVRLAKAKGSKVALEKKYDVLIKSHHHYKDIASGMRKTILGHREG